MNTHSIRRTALAAALLSALASAQAANIEVLHWWTTAGDAKAVRLLADKVGAKGDTWVDSAVGGGPGPGQQLAMSRMVAGNPPGAVQMSLGVRARDVAAEGLLGDVSDVAAKGKWAQVLPPAALRAMTAEGKLVGVPVTMHGINWMWFSRPVLEAAKVQPPNNWDELMIAADKIKAAGYLPFALSSQSWQIGWLYANILAGVGGRVVYEQYAAADPKVFQTPAAHKALDMLMRIRRMADDSQINRPWNTSAALLINNKAAFQFMGDWAKGEFLSAGKTVGPAKGELGCMLTPGTADFYVMMGDALVMPKAVKPDVAAAQKRLAETMMDRDMQVAFAKAKGSLPFRTDIKAADFDECAGLAIRTFSKPTGQVAGTAMTWRGEVTGAVTDALAKIWAQPNISPKQAADTLASAMQKAL